VDLELADLEILMLVVDRASRKSWQVLRKSKAKTSEGNSIFKLQLSQNSSCHIGLVLKVLTSFAAFVEEELS
jgi:hypothetical protein